MINQRNYDFKLLNLIADFLNSDFENVITKQIEDIAEDGVSPELELRIFMGEAVGLDTFGADRAFFNEYYPKAIKRLNPDEFKSDPYYKNVKFDGAKKGEVELCMSSYKKYEPFVCDDISVDFKGMLIPEIGFFEEEFTYPAVKENGVLWMSVTPNEINTMKRPAKNAHGKVLTLGLGLGYFAYLCAIKSEVSSVTVIERNEKVIELFNEYILPQFPNAGKIRIIKSDGVEFFKSPTENDFDYIFCDLWHDVSDGIPLSNELKKHEHNFPNAKIEYWIEKSMKLYR